MSREVGAFLALLSVAAMLAFASGPFADHLAARFRPFFAHPHAIALDDAAFLGLMVETLLAMGLLLATPFAALVAVALASGLAQTGPLWTLEPLKPKLERISPIKGFGRLFSLRSLVEFLKSLTKVILVTLVLWAILQPHAPMMVEAARLPLIGLARLIEEMAVQLIAAAAALMAVVAVLDVAYQRFELTKQLRMSKRDIRDEHKQSEGDPMVKQRLRALRMERARRRMIADVPKSTVVVTNPTHVAVALRWNQEEASAPKVMAKGVDHLALRIRAIAIDHGVPIVENPPLARALERGAEVGDLVPTEHYRAVAEVIGFVLRQSQRTAGNPNGPRADARSDGDGNGDLSGAG